MSSQINAALINGSFPVQGVDNPSQGFRSNFTNTAVNFQYAANEITELQNKSILSAPLTDGQVLTNDMNGSPFKNAVISNLAEQTVNIGTQTGLVTLNYTAGHYQSIATQGTPSSGASISFAFSNWPSTNYGWMTLAVSVSSVLDTITFPTSVVGLNGVVGAVLTSSGTTLSFATTGTYLFNFNSTNGGTTIYGTSNNPLLVPFNASSEILPSGGTISLGVNTTFFNSSTDATLAAGVEGQVKQLVIASFIGPVTITVAHAAWMSGGSGTVTLDQVGAIATLQFLSGSWYPTSLFNASTF